MEKGNAIGMMVNKDTKENIQKEKKWKRKTIFLEWSINI